MEGTIQDPEENMTSKKTHKLPSFLLLAEKRKTQKVSRFYSSPERQQGGLSHQEKFGYFQEGAGILAKKKNWRTSMSGGGGARCSTRIGQESVHYKGAHAFNLRPTHGTRCYYGLREPVSSLWKEGRIGRGVKK